MDLKGLLADQMGAFTPYDIGGAVLALLLAALLGFVLGLIGRSPGAASPKQLAALAATTALAVLFVRASVPLAIALVGVALLVRPGIPEQRDASWRAFLFRLAAVVAGVGCGSSAAVVAVVLALPLALLLRWSVPDAS